jgi:DNA repair protein SbcC/Rad50
LTAHRLNKLEIEHFRSINDPVTLRLDAPVVLIHGHNGAGKTSLLSAIELALTGVVPSLERADPTYGTQLLHYGSLRGRVALDYSTDDGPASAEVELGRNSFERKGGLQKSQAQFFSERCFLAQSLLSQLLTIYQQSGSDLESPLSRFVNELLGLDRLDALERGLRPCLDLRNTKKIAPSYIALERERDRLREQVARNQKLDETAREQQTLATGQLNQTLEQLGILGLQFTADQADLESALGPAEEVDEIKLYSDAAQRASAAGRTWNRLNTVRANSAREALEDRLRSSEAALESWRAEGGTAISSLFVRASELGLSAPASSGIDIGSDLQEYRGQWNREAQRQREQLQRNEISTTRLRRIEDEQTALDVRASNLARQLTSAAGDADGLSHALAAILPHIHEPNCPVCGRDYSEVSDHALTEDLSTKIAELGDLAERLARLSRDQAMTTRRQAELNREADGIKSGLIPETEMLSLQNRLAKIDAAVADGAKLQTAANEGTLLLVQNTEARRSVDLWSSLDSEERALRDDLIGLGRNIGITLDWTGLKFPEAIARIEARSVEQLERSRSVQNLKLSATKQISELAARKAAADSAASELKSTKEVLARVTNAHAAAEAIRNQVRSIVHSVTRARSDVVSRVFNDRLNKVWRDLFVRLAPAEAFVPSFFLPTGDGAKESRPVLRTLHRSGDQGGAPGAMLSAGNLNTAALTLFLALHLSVEVRLPWLLLDDPVQSMDEVHISQFAALLRTLSKEHGRQVFIAVHDRPLFDYLSLELSPAFNGDELITIEISTSSNGRTRVTPNRLGYKEERTIIHAA